MRFASIVLSIFASMNGVDAIAQQSWTEVGGSATGGGVSAAATNVQFHEVAVDRQGRAVVAWVDSNHLYLRRWNGSTWEELGGSGSGTGISGGTIASGYVGLALDSNDNPCLAYMIYHPSPIQDSDIYFLRWDGLSWIELGGSATGNGISQAGGWSYTPALALDAADNPCVAWAQYVAGGSYEAYLRRWDGQQWAEVGGSASGGGISAMSTYAFLLKVALTPSGNPVVAWKYDPGTVGSGIINYANQEVFLRSWNGSAWQELGGSASGSGVSDSPTGLGLHYELAVDGAGYPILVWRELGSADIILRRWNGSSWVALGNSASPGGLSDSETFCGDPTLVLDGAGNPIVAWGQGATSAGQEILVRRWTGSSWDPIAGSDSATGISDTSAYSGVPRITLSPLGRVYVSWLEGSADDADVWLKRIDNPPAFNQTTVGGAVLPIGGVVDGLHMRASASFEMRPDSLVRIEVEMRPVGVAFTGTATLLGDPIGIGAETQAFVGPLAPGGWHWRARVAMPTGEATEWVAFGDNPESEADFITTAIPLATPDSENDHDTGCGLTGLEAALVVAGVIAWTRRRRRTA
jgi:hypothetical protein